MASSGRFLAFRKGSQASRLMILPMEGDEVQGETGKALCLLELIGCRVARLSGRWVLAGTSRTIRQEEVYVRPFPVREGKWLVSSGGGQWPTWSRAKRELLYQTLDNQIMAVPYTVEGDSFRGEAPRLWTERRILRRPRLRSLDLHPDGERVAAAVATEGRAEDSRDKVVFIFNFFDELRRIALTFPPSATFR